MKDLKWKFIVNPNSALGKCKKKWEKAEPYVKKAGITYSVSMTSAPQQGGELAQEAVREGCNRIIVVSGDGVVNEVANGLIELGKNERDKVSMGVLPFGTGNDYNTVLGLPWSPEKAVHTLVNETKSTIVNAGKFKIIDTGFEKHFINVLDMGISSDVGLGLLNNEISFIKGPRRYTLLALKKLLTVKQRSATVKLDDQGPIDINLMLVTIGLGKSNGGGMLCCIDGHPQNNHFNVFITKDVTKFQTLLGIKRIYSGKHKNMKGTLFEFAKKIEIQTETAIPFDFDGEIYYPDSIGTHLKVEMVENAFNVLYNPHHPSVNWLSEDEASSSQLPNLTIKHKSHDQARKWQEKN